MGDFVKDNFHSGKDNFPNEKLHSGKFRSGNNSIGLWNKFNFIKGFNSLDLQMRKTNLQLMMVGEFVVSRERKKCNPVIILEFLHGEITVGIVVEGISEIECTNHIDMLNQALP